MELSKVCAIFAAMAGMTTEEALKHLGLVHLSIAEIKSALKPGIDQGQNARVLRYAAAATAFYRYSVLVANTCGIQRVRPRENTLGADPSSTVEVASAIREEFLTLAAPLFQDQQFGFRAV